MVRILFFILFFLFFVQACLSKHDLEYEIKGRTIVMQEVEDEI